MACLRLLHIEGVPVRFCFFELISIFALVWQYRVSYKLVKASLRR